MYEYTEQSDNLVSTPIHEIGEHSSSDDFAEVITEKPGRFKPYIFTELKQLSSACLTSLARYYEAGVKPFVDAILMSAWTTPITLPVQIWAGSETATINAFTRLIVNIPLHTAMIILSMFDYYGFKKTQYPSKGAPTIHFIKRFADGITPMMVSITLLANAAGALFTIYQCGDLDKKACIQSPRANDPNALLAVILITIVGCSLPSCCAASGTIGIGKNLISEIANLEDIDQRFGTDFTASKYFRRAAVISYKLASLFRTFGDLTKFFAIGYGAIDLTLKLNSQWLPENAISRVLAGSAATAAEEITAPVMGAAGIVGSAAAILYAKNYGRNFIKNFYFLLAGYALLNSDVFNMRNAYDTHQDESSISQAIQILLWIRIGLFIATSMIALLAPFILNRTTSNRSLTQNRISLDSYTDYQKIEEINDSETYEQEAYILKKDKSCVATLLARFGLNSKRPIINNDSTDEEEGMLLYESKSHKRLSFCGLM